VVNETAIVQRPGGAHKYLLLTSLERAAMANHDRVAVRKFDDSRRFRGFVDHIAICKSFRRYR